MNLLSRSSGQKINLDKSRMFFSKNIGRNLKQQISSEVGTQWTDDLGKYLGVCIFHKRPPRMTFQFIIDKVHQRLSA